METKSLKLKILIFQILKPFYHSYDSFLEIHIKNNIYK